MQGQARIKTVNVGMIGTNCYVLYKADNENNDNLNDNVIDNKQSTKQAIIVDPGDDAEKIYNAVEQLDVTPVAVLLTHGHFDHILAVNEVASKYNIYIYASDAEKQLLEDDNLNLSASYRRNCTVKKYVALKDKEKINLAGFEITPILTPGHTAGSTSYYIDDEKILFSGDMLFQESVGRTDFPTGSDRDIINSLNNKLMKLDDSVKVYPGHGPDTTIGYERQCNPYVVR